MDRSPYMNTLSAACLVAAAAPVSLAGDGVSKGDVITVKLHDDLPFRLHDDAKRVFADATWHRSSEAPPEKLDALRATAQQKLGRSLMDFNTYYVVELPDGLDTAAAMDELRLLDIVERVEPAPPSPPPPTPPVLGPNQGGLNASPIGVDAYAAWEHHGARGAGVRVATIDYNWNSSHVDLPAVTLLGSAPPAGFPKDHATAAMGIVGALDDGAGTTGIAPDASLYFAAAELATWNVAGAIMTTLATLQAGDVILIEQQWFGPNYDPGNPDPQYGLVPVEWRLDCYDAIQTAIGNGVIVVEAAGNGSQNLDGVEYLATPGDGDPTNDHEPFTAANDSGAIMVGAGSVGAPFGPSLFSRGRLWFSNYGSTLDLQGWGESVYTLGYGDAYASGGTNAWYTGVFGGTSSASAMVAGVVAMVQSSHTAATGTPLTPAQMSALLTSNGAPSQTPGQNIGPFPDAVAAITSDLGVCTPGWTEFFDQAIGFPQVLDLYGTATGPDGPALYAGADLVGLASGISRWDGSSWSGLGSGIDVNTARIEDMIVYDDGNGAHLYIGGRIPFAGDGSTLDNVGRWNGSTWSSLGTGTSAPNEYPYYGNADVHEVEVYDDGGGADLYVGGFFTHAGGIASKSIARWDGSSWSSVAGGTADGGVHTMTVFDDGSGAKLYAAGGFSSIGGVPATNVARWDGTAWQAVGSGITGTILDLAVYDDGNGPRLYAGGQNIMTGVHLVMWNGSSWVVPGGGVLGTVWDLAVYDDGTGDALFINGEIFSAGSAWVNGVAKWDGTRWWPVDLGIGGGGAFGAKALATWDDGNGEALYVSPVAYSFPGYDPVNAPVIRWDGCAGVSPPCPADTDGSGGVDVTDLVNVILAWGICPPPPATCPEDIDGDGVVGVTDLVAVILQYGPCP